MLLKNFRSKLILMVYAIILLFCNILYNTDLSANELIIYEKQGFSSKFQDINSKELDLKNFEGKLILVNLWATWCEPCKEEMPSLDRLQKKFEKNIFQILPISLDRGPKKNSINFFNEPFSFELSATSMTQSVFRSWFSLRSRATSLSRSCLPYLKHG